MPAGRFSIGQVMGVVALAGVTFAVLRAAPMELVMYPTIWVFLGVVDFVVLWKLILARTLRSAHYTFLIVLVVAFFVMANLVATGQIRPLGFLVRGYQYLTAEEGRSLSLEFLGVYEFWMAGLLGLGLGSATGLFAGWLERRRGWRIAEFCRGALVGFGIFALLAMLGEAVWPGGSAPSPVHRILHLVVLVACLIVGGVLGLSRRASSDRGREGRES